MCYLWPIKGTFGNSIDGFPRFSTAKKVATDWFICRFRSFSLPATCLSGDILQNWEFEAPSRHLRFYKKNTHNSNRCVLLVRLMWMTVISTKCCRNPSVRHAFLLKVLSPKPLGFFWKNRICQLKRGLSQKVVNGQNIMGRPEYGTKIPTVFFGGRPEIPTLGPAIKLELDQWNESDLP